MYQESVCIASHNHKRLRLMPEPWASGPVSATAGERSPFVHCTITSWRTTADTFAESRVWCIQCASALLSSTYQCD